MKKDIEWLKNEIGELPCVDTVFNSEGSSYIDSAVPVMAVYDLIDKLDEPEVLSQEWIEENVVHVRGLGDIFEAEAVENLLVPKQELPVLPKYVAEYLEFAKKEASLIQVMELVSIDGWLTMKKEFDWISANDETFARAWLDGYEVADEPLYYALIKGHELIDSGETRWHFDISDDSVFVSKLYSIHDNFITEMSKEDWNKLGINDSNADFVKAVQGNG